MYDKAYFPSKFVPFLSLFEGEILYTFYNGLQSFSTTDTYKTVMIKLLNDHPKLHRYRGNFATREVRTFYKCTNTMNNLPKCIEQFDSQTVTGVQLL